MNVKDAEIKDLIAKYKKITVVGLSPDKSKPSHQIPLFMQNQSYDVVGIYPAQAERTDFKIYQNLSEVPAEQRKFVNVFRRSEQIPEVVDQVLAVGGVEVLWLQLGISHPEAEKKAEAAGIKVVSNRCWLIEYKKYF